VQRSAAEREAASLPRPGPNAGPSGRGALGLQAAASSSGAQDEEERVEVVVERQVSSEGAARELGGA
jgi:hypothetical protein